MMVDLEQINRLLDLNRDPLDTTKEYDVEYLTEDGGYSGTKEVGDSITALIDQTIEGEQGLIGRILICPITEDTVRTFKLITKPRLNR